MTETLIGINSTTKTTLVTGKPAVRNDKVSNAAAQSGAFTPDAKNDPASLSGKNVTHNSPFSAFVNFLLSILRFLIGSSTPEDVKPAPIIEPVKSTPIKTESPKAPSPKKELQSILNKYEGGVRSLVGDKLEPAQTDDFVKTKLQEAKLSFKKGNDLTALQTHLFSAENKQAILLDCDKFKITELFRRELSNELNKLNVSELFNKVYPAFNTALQELLSKTTDLQALKKPLAALARQLIAEATPKKADPVAIPDSKMNKTLQEIAVNLAQGALVLDRQAIFKKYPSLEKDLEKMPEQKKQFEMILSKAWIAHQLKTPSNSRGNKLEMTVLKSLGYDTSNYNEEVLRKELDGWFNKNLFSIENLPKEFEKKAFSLRAKSVPEQALENLRTLIDYYSGKRKELIRDATAARDALRVESRLPKAVAYLKELFHSRNVKKINEHFEKFLTGARKEICPHLTSSNFKTFLDSLPPLSKDIKGRFKPDENFKKAEAWFVKYEGMIIGEFTQGEDDEEGLVGEGVCVGLTYRMAKIALESPDASIFKIAVRSVKNDDKVIQDYHDGKSKDSYLLLPPEVLASEGKKENILFVASGDMNVGVGLIQHMSQPELLKELKNSNGAIMLGWDRHATFMRFDPQKNKFFFFDPNFTTVEFKKKIDESYEQLAIRMTMAYIELYQWAYPDRKTMSAHQIVPLKAGEPVPTGKIDKSKILVYN